MTEEIKEILYKFDKVLENYELDKKTKSFSVDSICHLFPNEMITIKNYITNLQKENEKLKGTLQTDKLMKAFMVEHNRNEKAIEYIKRKKLITTEVTNGNIIYLLNILDGGDE